MRSPVFCVLIRNSRKIRLNLEFSLNDEPGMMKRPSFFPGLLLGLIALVTLAGCGGGGGSGGGSSSSSSSSSSTSSSSSSGTASSSSGGATGNGPFIVIDQFGYLPVSRKIAVIRDPQTGFDAADAYTPGGTFELVNADTDAVVMSAAIAQWNSGNTDPSSGDRAWWFDFSSVETPGNYYVRDAEHDVVSPEFTINANVYKDVLKQAMRTFFYQRAGKEKVEPYAEAGWEDSASHLQDSEARLYSAPGDAGTEKDLQGGWYDAGDYNKYTNWAADYVIGLLHAYLENPAAWGDDFNIPESSNTIPDILDEVKWGIDWLKRMQDGSEAGAGSVLPIVGLAGGSPPSSATGQSLYGSASTSATLTTAAAFALGAKVFAGVPGLAGEAADLQTRAEQAWDWADANPDVIFRNNDSNPPYNSAGLGAGQQEVDDNGRVMKKLEAAVYLFELTGDTDYRTYFDNNYTSAELIASTFANEFAESTIHFLLYYANLPNATASVAGNIQSKFEQAMNGGTAWGAINGDIDPYRAPLLAYTWGSSGVKAGKGLMFYEQVLYGLGTPSETEVKNVAARYIHYLHGVNPLGKVYLSNMGAHGAENSVDQFYHSWFANGSELWDSVSESTYGPPPGFLVGGPNPSYDWDACCNSTCGSPANDAMCMRPTPPYGEPDQKAYADFNDSWPVDSWSVTENSDGYQIRYLRLLSKFVD